MGILDDIISASSGGLLGGQNGSKKLWGTSINQDTPAGTFASNMVGPMGGINQGTHMLGLNNGNPLMSNTHALELAALIGSGAAVAGAGAGAGAAASPYALANGATGIGGFGLSPSAGMGLHAGTSAAASVPAASGLLAAPSTFQSVMGVAKPVGEAAMAANAVKGLFPSSQPMQPSPITPPQQNQNLSQIVAGNNQESQMMQQQIEQERARRMALLARFGGR